MIGLMSVLCSKNFGDSDIPNFWITILQFDSQLDGELLVCDQATSKVSKNV